MGIGMLLYFIFISSPCWTEPIHIVASPDRKLKAILWEADCGATTSATYTVYLLPFGDKPTFNPQLDEKTIFYGADYVNVCGLYWTSPSSLVLEIAGEGKRWKEPQKSLPLSAITKDPTRTGEVSFDLLHVAHTERCTIGWPWVLPYGDDVR